MLDIAVSEKTVGRIVHKISKKTCVVVVKITSQQFLPSYFYLIVWPLPYGRYLKTNSSLTLGRWKYQWTILVMFGCRGVPDIQVSPHFSIRKTLFRKRQIQEYTTIQLHTSKSVRCCNFYSIVKNFYVQIQILSPFLYYLPMYKHHIEVLMCKLHDIVGVS